MDGVDGRPGNGVVMGLQVGCKWVVTVSVGCRCGFARNNLGTHRRQRGGSGDDGVVVKHGWTCKSTQYGFESLGT